MLNQINEIINSADKIIWGVPLIVLILLTGIYLTLRLSFFQIRFLPTALKYMWCSEENGKGEVSSFSALCTALSATIGTGNIAGVATAVGVLAGGPGALFWMILAAFFGMATKYAEGFLAIKYRTIDENNHVCGGPFYYIEKGMGIKWKWLAKFFALSGALAGLLGIGTFAQINSITSAIEAFFDPKKINTVNILNRDYTLAVVIGGFIAAVITTMVLIGGIKRISSVAQLIVPFMAVLYVLTCSCVIILNIGKLPNAVVEVFEGAFAIRPIAGGILASLMITIKSGVSKGIFSNEAGLGSAPIAAAAAQTNDTVRQGLVSMTGTFIDTILICSMTGITIIMMGSWKNTDLQSVQVTVDAFQKGLFFLPDWTASAVIMLCLIFFAVTTIMGWSYYGERCVEYLFDGNMKIVKFYRLIYIIAVFMGPYLTVSAVWTIANIFNGLMAFPNLVALLALSGIIIKETKTYLKNVI